VKLLKLITNVRALNNLASSNLHSKALDASLQRLSSGLKINSAFDDASGLSISNSLNSSANTLAQSIKNASDATGLLSIADKAMDEQSKILDTIKTKATAAAQDGQSTKTRKMLLADIAKLLEEFDHIANTTSYNSLSLLNGSFSNKVFQVGTNANTTIKTSIQSTHSNKISTTHFMTSSAIGFGNFDEALKLKITNSATQKEYIISSKLDNSSKGLGEIAEEINKISDLTGLKAFAQNQYIGINTIKAGRLDNNFTINGVSFGEIQVKDNDSDGSLVATINALKHTSGVEAHTENGRLILTSLQAGGIVLGGMDDKTRAILNMSSNSAIVAESFPAGGFGQNGLTLNGIGVGASNNKEEAVKNINAVEDQSGVYAFLKDGKIHFVSKDPSKNIEIGGNASGNMGIEFRTVRGNAVLNTANIRRTANTNHTFSMSYYDLNNIQRNVTLRMPPKPDGRYYLQDLVDAINASGSGFRASVEDLGNNRIRIVLEAPKDMSRFRGFGTVSGPTPPGGGNADTLGVSNTIFNNPKLATATQIYESFGRLTLSSPSGLSQVEVFQHGQKANGVLGLAQNQSGFSSKIVSLKELVHMNDEELNEALGVFSASDTFTKSLADKNTLSLRRAMALMDASENALTGLNFIRSDIGSVRIQLDSTMNNLITNELSLRASSSQIKDLDFAQESTNFARNNIFAQANSISLYNILDLQEKLLSLYLDKGNSA